MCNEALFTPKHATLETVRTLGALLLTVSTSSLTGFAFSNGQHVNQGVQMNTGGKICQITTTRHSANKLAFRASDCVSTMAWSVPVFQALQAETVTTWEVFWFCVYVSAHWTRNFFTKIVRQRCDIHGSSVFLRRQREFRNEVLWLCFIFQSFFGILLWLSFQLHQLIRDPCLKMKSHPHVLLTTHAKLTNDLAALHMLIQLLVN